jgi:hypothetical protein
MTDEQINAAIAEALGCAEINVQRRSDINPTNFSADLNAMHEAEKALKNVTQQIDYTNYLYDMECENQERTGRWMPYSISSRQRAEAFLRTLGKWGETK